MPLLLFALGLYLGRWLADHTPIVEAPHWFDRLLCRFLGHNWSQAGWHAFPDPVYLTHAWICFRCGEQHEELTRMTSDGLRGLTYEEWQALEKQRPARR